MRLDTGRLAEPITTISGYGKMPDSGLGKLVRWLIYIYRSSISEIERKLQLKPSMLNQDMRLRKRQLTGGFPVAFSNWLQRLTGVRITPDEIQVLSTLDGDEWHYFADQIKEKLL
jgi:hypothetical protein